MNFVSFSFQFTYYGELSPAARLVSCHVLDADSVFSNNVMINQRARLIFIFCKLNKFTVLFLHFRLKRNDSF